MKRWIIGFLMGLCVYLIASIALATVMPASAAAGIGFLLGVTAMAFKVRSDRPGTDI